MRPDDIGVNQCSPIQPISKHPCHVTYLPCQYPAVHVDDELICLCYMLCATCLDESCDPSEAVEYLFKSCAFCAKVVLILIFCKALKHQPGMPTEGSSVAAMFVPYHLVCQTPFLTDHTAPASQSLLNPYFSHKQQSQQRQVCTMPVSSSEGAVGKIAG